MLQVYHVHPDQPWNYNKMNTLQQNYRRANDRVVRFADLVDQSQSKEIIIEMKF